MEKEGILWRQRAEVFQARAEDYDRWFEESLLFDIELTALQELKTPLLEPKIEIGVGPGRFARALHVSFGVDPAFAPLKISRTRDINVIQAIGEELPFAGRCAGSLFILFTLCFLAEPTRVFAECYRILRSGGCLVLGMVPASGCWGRFLLAKKGKKHPFYRHATFYEARQAAEMIRNAGFSLIECRSSLFQQPGKVKDLEYSRPGIDDTAGFCLLVGRKDKHAK